MPDSIDRRSAVKWMGLGTAAMAFSFDDFIKQNEKSIMNQILVM